MPQWIVQQPFSGDFEERRSSSSSRWRLLRLPGLLLGREGAALLKLRTSWRPRLLLKSFTSLVTAWWSRREVAATAQSRVTLQPSNLRCRELHRA